MGLSFSIMKEEREGGRKGGKEEERQEGRKTRKRYVNIS